MKTRGAPHVDGGGVDSLAKQQLRRAVPQRHHKLRVCAQWRPILAREAKVGDLEYTLAVSSHAPDPAKSGGQGRTGADLVAQQQVGRLQIACELA